MDELFCGKGYLRKVMRRMGKINEKLGAVSVLVDRCINDWNTNIV